MKLSTLLSPALIGLDVQDTDYVGDGVTLVDIHIGGVYKHFKGHRVVVTGIAEDTETETQLVLYHHINSDVDNRTTWARPFEMFIGYAELNGNQVPRFKYMPDC